VQGQAGTNGANDLSELLSNRPDAVNPVIGYNVLPANYMLAALTPGKILDTTDTAKSGTNVQGVPETLMVNVTSNSGTGGLVSHSKTHLGSKPHERQLLCTKRVENTCLSSGTPQGFVCML